MLTPRYKESRGIKRRLVIEGILELTSPTHLGGSDPTAVTDAPIARDSLTGKPILYGTTLAGLLRGTLADRMAGPRQAEPAEIDAFFGGRAGDDDGEQSPLIVEDALCSEGGKTDIRDGVAIEVETGVAEQGKKFDMELLRPGTRFPVYLELVLGEKGESESDENEDAFRLKCLLTCMDALEKGEVLLGARSRKGFGRCTVLERSGPDEKPYRWAIRDFNMAAREGLFQWMAWGSDDVVGAEYKSTPKYFEWAQDIPDGKNKEGAIFKKEYAEFTADLIMSVDSSLLIRSGGHDPTEADAVQLSAVYASGSKPVVSGTSLSGVVRSRSLRIADTIAGPSKGQWAKRFITEMFGGEVKEKKLQGGLVYIEESPIKDGNTMRHTRVRIDRWTGGALEHLLFEEDAQFGGNVSLKFRLPLSHGQKKNQAMVGLLLCVIKDLFTGDLPVGGEASIGRGRLLGKKGTLVYREKNQSLSEGEKWQLTSRNEDREFDIEGSSESLQHFVDALIEYLQNERGLDDAD